MGQAKSPSNSYKPAVAPPLTPRKPPSSRTVSCVKSSIQRWKCPSCTLTAPLANGETLPSPIITRLATFPTDARADSLKRASLAAPVVLAGPEVGSAEEPSCVEAVACFGVWDIESNWQEEVRPAADESLMWGEPVNALQGVVRGPDPAMQGCGAGKGDGKTGSRRLLV